MDNVLFHIKKMNIMQKEWISTPELLAYLKGHRDDEVECRLYLGNGIGSTHYWYWDSQSRLFMHTRDWPFSPFTEQEVMEYYGGCRWVIDM